MTDPLRAKAKAIAADLVTFHDAIGDRLRVYRGDEWVYEWRWRRNESHDK